MRLRQVLKILFSKMTAPGVFDVIAFCSVILPSTVLYVMFGTIFSDSQRPEQYNQLMSFFHPIVNASYLAKLFKRLKIPTDQGKIGRTPGFNR